jgi:hypothetical protein
MVIRQNSGSSHVELKHSQLWILLYFIDELISERGGIGFSIY